jgi:hypothetical protein
LGALADQIWRSGRTVYMNRSRAVRIEDDVRRRLKTSRRDTPPDALRVAIFKIRGGRRMVEVVEIRDEAKRDPFVMYAVKHGEELAQACCESLE